VGPAPQPGDDPLATCYAVTPAKKYYVGDYYSVVGVDQMKAALQDGPISCGMHVSDLFLEYTSGIYSEPTKKTQLINHEISIVGYSVDATTGEEYWIGRNSWGNYWGMYGFFYITMYDDNLKITNDCLAGMPTNYKPANAQEFI